jgi:hypothetical protein
MEGFFLKIFTSALWAKSSTAETLSTQSYRKETYYYLCESLATSVPLPHRGHHVEVVELYISKTKKNTLQVYYLHIWLLLLKIFSTAETLSTQSYRKETYYYLRESLATSVPPPHRGHHVAVV